MVSSKITPIKDKQLAKSKKSIERADKRISKANYQTMSLTTLTNAINDIKHIQEEVVKLFDAGEDYHIIPGTTKPALSKAGAQKVINIFNCRPKVTILTETENMEDGIFAYKIMVEAVNRISGKVLSEGIGACSNREAKYKNQDPYTLQNTVLKMAKKRAMVDASLDLGILAKVFTQDISDMKDIAGTPVINSSPETKLTQAEMYTELRNLLGGVSSKDPIWKKFKDKHLPKLIAKAKINKPMWLPAGGRPVFNWTQKEADIFMPIARVEIPKLNIEVAEVKKPKTAPRKRKKK